MSYDLYHHGIKGMKWGIRRFQNKNGSLTLLGKKRRKQMDDDDGSSGAKPKPKSVKEMSDQELREKISRLELERRYRDLNPQTTSKGKAFVSKVLERAGENIATQLATYVMGDAVNRVFKDIYKDAAIINPKKGQKDK